MSRTALKVLYIPLGLLVAIVVIVDVSRVFLHKHALNVHYMALNETVTELCRIFDHIDPGIKRVYAIRPGHFSPDYLVFNASQCTVNPPTTVLDFTYLLDDDLEPTDSSFGNVDTSSVDYFRDAYRRNADFASTFYIKLVKTSPYWVLLLVMLLATPLFYVAFSVCFCDWPMVLIYDDFAVIPGFPYAKLLASGLIIFICQVELYRMFFKLHYSVKVDFPESADTTAIVSPLLVVFGTYILIFFTLQFHYSFEYVASEYLDYVAGLCRKARELDLVEEKPRLVYMPSNYSEWVEWVLDMSDLEFDSLNYADKVRLIVQEGVVSSNFTLVAEEDKTRQELDSAVTRLKKTFSRV